MARTIGHCVAVYYIILLRTCLRFFHEGFSTDTMAGGGAERNRVPPLAPRAARGVTMWQSYVNKQPCDSGTPSRQSNANSAGGVRMPTARGRDAVSSPLPPRALTASRPGAAP